MEHVVESSSQSAKCNQLLVQSNQLYIMMLETLTLMGKSPDNATTVQLDSRLLNFRDLQLHIETSDAQLATELKSLTAHDNSTTTLLEQRRQLIEQVLTANKAVTLRAKSIQSLLADEIRKSGTGHTALRGYRQQPDQHRSNTLLKRTM